MCRVSIIVPVYKVEKYIHRCIDSILAQTFTDFELILVDDGSPDNCGFVCDQYAEKDKRVVVIHQENAGASAARNAGIRTARGEYLMFCDSDDVVSPMWVERLMQYADGHTLPMGAYCREASQLGAESRKIVSSGVLYPKSSCYAFEKAGIAGYLCNSLFSAKIVREQGLLCREKREQGDYNEDLLFFLQYARHVEKLVYTGYTDYLYDTREGSLSRSVSQLYFEKYQEKFWLRYAFVKEVQGPEEDAIHLAETSVYHFLVAMKQAFSSGDYLRFREIVVSEAMKKCLALSPCSKESKKVIRLLRKQAALRLWVLFTISSLKGRK